MASWPMRVRTMSDNNLPATVVTDFSADDLVKIQDFKDRGLPGLDRVAEVQMERMMNLYLEGKNYHQISRIMRLPKVMIMYLSERFGWCEMRVEYLNDLQTHLHIRTVESKIASQDFLFQLQHMFQKKIGRKIQEYLQTDNESVADQINLKEVDKYVKVIEAIDKITTDRLPKDKDGRPLIGLNIGEQGVTITKKSDNTMEITPKDKTIGDKLKEFADMRRKIEAETKVPNKSDIDKKDNKQGDNNET